MKTALHTYSAILASSAMLCTFGTCNALAEEGSPIWDSAVNSLLATSMYGIANPHNKGLSVRLQQSTDLYKGLAADNISINSQAITFSYEGSSGLLGFSAGYLYTGESSDNQPGKVFLGIDPTENLTFNPARSWFMAFDLSQSYQYDDIISFSLGSKSMLNSNPLDTEEGKTFSMLFNMPISYRRYITITPEFQWLRTLKDQNAPLGSFFEEGNIKDTFYGGVSVSFSY